MGFEVTYVEGLVLSQKKFTNDLLQDSGLSPYKKVVTPLPLNLKLHSNDSPLHPDATKYRSFVGKLNFLTNTRPDLFFVVQSLSKYMQNPTENHFKALHHTLHYVAATCGQGILLKGSTFLKLKAYSNSDWGACLDTRHSVTGYIILFGSSPISWKSKKQCTVSKSSSEAEYSAMAAVASEITWLVRLLEDFGVTDLRPVTLECENKSAIQMAHNPVLHHKTKHIAIDSFHLKKNH